MGRGRVTSQYAVREARAPKPSREEGDRDREDREEDREKDDRGRDGRRLHKSSEDSEPRSPVLERSDRNHSGKCIAEREEDRGERKYPVKQKEITQCIHITKVSLCQSGENLICLWKHHNNKHVAGKETFCKCFFS